MLSIELIDGLEWMTPEMVKDHTYGRRDHDTYSPVEIPQLDSTRGRFSTPNYSIMTVAIISTVAVVYCGCMVKAIAVDAVALLCRQYAAISEARENKRP